MLPRVYQAFFILNSAKHKIYPANNVKMATIVGILTFMSRINNWFCNLKLKFPLILATSVFMSSLNFMLSPVQLEKSLITSGPGRKPRRQVFSLRGSPKISLLYLNLYCFNDQRLLRIGAILNTARINGIFRFKSPRTVIYPAH